MLTCAFSRLAQLGGRGRQDELGLVGLVGGGVGGGGGGRLSRQAGH